ncbi:FAD-dependent oxidoreductase, partial [Bacteroides ovatus]
MEINRRDFITKVSAIAALSVLPSSFVAAMGNEKVEKAKPKYPTLKCDVVVVGAGPGGVPAAIAAARQGAKVILLEEDNMPGGAPVDMYVPFI